MKDFILILKKLNNIINSSTKVVVKTYLKNIKIDIFVVLFVNNIDVKGLFAIIDIINSKIIKNMYK